MANKEQQIKARRASLTHSLFSESKTNSIIILNLSQTVVNIPLAKITDLSKLAGFYMQAVADWTGVCATCGAIFHKHDRYQRKTPFLGTVFFIKRVYCPGCKKAHALIPCFVFPYSRVMAAVKEKAIKNICFENQTIEQLAEVCGVEPATIKSWWKNFRKATGELTAWVAKELAKANRPADWLSGASFSERQRGRRLLILFGLYRSTYHPDFLQGDFDLLCLLKPCIFLPSRRQNVRC